MIGNDIKYTGRPNAVNTMNVGSICAHAQHTAWMTVGFTIERIEKDEQEIIEAFTLHIAAHQTAKCVKPHGTQ